MSVEMAVPEKRWYIVRVRPGLENSVVRSLKERIQREAMVEQFGDIMVPTEEVLEVRGGKKRKVPRKFFPNYVLINMEMNEQTWYLVHKAPNVLGFLGGNSDSPVPLAAHEIEGILGRLQETVDKPRPKLHFEPGQMVRIIDGPFADFNGMVEEADYEKKHRVRVSVFVLGRSTTVELEFTQVEKA